jgi:hypothetical protein
VLVLALVCVPHSTRRQRSEPLVPGESGELVVQTILHATKWWLIVPITIGGQITIEMVLDTGSPLSAISERLRNTLLSAGLLESITPRTYLLRSLTIQGQVIPDLRVRLSRRVTSVGADGILGLDFLAQFSTVHFDVATLRLTLTPASGL